MLAAEAVCAILLEPGLYVAPKTPTVPELAAPLDMFAVPGAGGDNIVPTELLLDAAVVALTSCEIAIGTVSDLTSVAVAEAGGDW